MHIPVLKKEVIEYLGPKENQNFVDCTIGEGGHTLEILKKTGPQGKVLGIDRDPEIIKKLKVKFQELKLIQRVILVCGNFSELKNIIERENFKPIDGILFDLGICSWHLEESGRGFSFLRDEPLDMRYNAEKGVSVKEILNYWPEKEIEKILKEFAQEKFAKRIAREIEKERKRKKIETTFQLVEIIKRATPKWYHRQRIHFATKSFQALRIAVNKELENLRIALPQSLEILEKGGKIVIISFHSLEDKIVKNFLKVKEKEGKLKILTKKPIRPSLKEIKINPRSRSARLRAGEKI